MKNMMLTAMLYTLITAVLLGIGYPLAITAIAHVLFPEQAAGELITRNGHIIGSHLIGQPFTGAKYFHSRPSAAGTGYDAGSSSGSNLVPTNKTLIDRIQTSVTIEQDGSASPVPIDLVTESGSGLDPDVSPAAALYQISRIAQQRHLTDAPDNTCIRTHDTTTARPPGRTPCQRSRPESRARQSLIRDSRPRTTLSGPSKHRNDSPLNEGTVVAAAGGVSRSNPVAYQLDT